MRLFWRVLFFVFYIFYILLPFLTGLMGSISILNGSDSLSNSHNSFLQGLGVIGIIAFTLQMDILFIYIPIFRNTIKNFRDKAFNILWFILVIPLAYLPILGIVNYEKQGELMDGLGTFLAMISCFKLFAIGVYIIYFLIICFNKKHKFYFRFF